MSKTKEAPNLAEIQRVQAAVGIKCACCETCRHLSSDNDGAEPESSVSWPTCGKVERYQYLKSFPFKKTMPCWQPDFWASKFANQIRTGSTRELNRLTDKFVEAEKAAARNDS